VANNVLTTLTEDKRIATCWRQQLLPTTGGALLQLPLLLLQLLLPLLATVTTNSSYMATDTNSN